MILNFFYSLKYEIRKCDLRILKRTEVENGLITLWEKPESASNNSPWTNIQAGVWAEDERSYRPDPMSTMIRQL